jgi:hypothetical protein
MTFKKGLLVHALDWAVPLIMDFFRHIRLLS